MCVCGGGGGGGKVGYMEPPPKVGFYMIVLVIKIIMPRSQLSVSSFPLVFALRLTILSDASKNRPCI